MALYRFREIAQRVTLLPLAGLGDREEAGRGDFPTATAIAETDLAPLHRRPQRPLGLVVGRLDALLFDKGKQSLAVNEESGGQVPHFAVGIVQVSLRQGEQLLLQGNRFPKELTPIDRLRIPPPIPQVAAKPIPKTKQPGPHRERE